MKCSKFFYNLFCNLFCLLYPKINNKKGYCCLFSLCALFLGNSIYSQQNNEQAINTLYSFSATSGTFTPLSTGTNVSSIQVDDALSASLPIGFTFMVGCDNYTTVKASSNGFLRFDSSTSDSAPSFSGSEVVLSPLAADLSGVGGTATFSTTGTAPNRVFTMEWLNYKWQYNATLPTMSFQVKLYETSNRIEFIYRQESGAISGGSSARIGIYNGLCTINDPTVATPNTNVNFGKYILQSSSAAPTISHDTFPDSGITSKPATNQVYRFDNISVCNLECKGLVTFNSTGGTNATNGLRIQTTGAGNLQVLRQGQFQIYRDDLATTNYFSIQSTGTVNNIILSVGNTLYDTGKNINFTSSNYAGRLHVISNTCQSNIGSIGGTQQNIIKYIALKNGLAYYLTVTYSYTYASNSFTIKYEVTIPSGNTETVRLSHAWDTLLGGTDTGPGFVLGAAPYLTMGVQKSGVYEAFKYKSGVAWSGYYSAVYNQISSNLGTNNTFQNTIDTNASTDNGIGISINFGSSAGTFSSTNDLIFVCNAGSTAPTLASNTAVVGACPSNTFNLNSLHTGTVPSAASLVWYTNNVPLGTPYSAPTTASEGVYYAFYYDAAQDCYSPASNVVTVSLNPSCICSASTVAPVVN